MLSSSNFVKAHDPRIDLRKPVKLLIEEGGGDINYRIYSATTASLSNINFTNINPSTPDIVLDKKVYISSTFTLNFTRSGAPVVANSVKLLAIGSTDGPRAFPLNQSIETTQMFMNGESKSFSTRQYIEPLMRYSNYRDMAERDFSSTPTYQDTYPQYHNFAVGPVPGSLNFDLAYGSAKNVLGAYGENGYNSGRGGFPSMKVLFDDGNSAIVEMYVVEPLIISPLGFGHHDKRGFYGLSTFQVQLTLASPPELTMWSRSTISEPYTVKLASVGTPEIMFTEIRPKSYDMLPERNIYPYHRNRIQSQLWTTTCFWSQSINCY
jgi:hypothetical protein